VFLHLLCLLFLHYNYYINTEKENIMPCRSYESDSSYQDNRIDELKEQNDRLARIACDAMTRLIELSTRTKSSLVINAETHAWWVKHQAADKAEQLRIANEAAKVRKAEEVATKRMTVIKSLTKEQREALGF
jgi:hypothetical protein